MKPSKLIVLLTLTVALAPTTAAVLNGGFEVDFDGDGMADNWQFAGDSGVTVKYSRDAGYTGQFSQMLDCTALVGSSPSSHAMLCQVDTVELKQGNWYKLSFAARQRGIAGGSVDVAISNTASWANCGLRESFRPKATWKEFEFVFRATQTISDHTRLQFWHTSTGALWLDDVKLEPCAPVVRRYTNIVAAGESPNLLANSSFECGRSGWGSIADIPGWGGNLNCLVGEIDDSQARFHDCSLSIALSPETTPVYYFDYFPMYRAPVKAPLLANLGWIAVEPGVNYTLSAYIKPDRENIKGVLSIHQAFTGALTSRIAIKQGWNRYSFTFKPRAGQVFAAVGMDLQASGLETARIWIDAVQLEKGPVATEYRPRATVEAAIETDRPGNFFDYGNKPSVTATVFNADRSLQNIELRLHTTDFDDAAVCDKTLSLQVPPGRKSTRIDLGVSARGFYRVKASSDRAAAIFQPPMRLVVIESYRQADSIFGMNHAYPWPELLELSKKMGLLWFRDWSLKWHDVEFEKGNFDFTEADLQIDRVLAHRLKVIGLLPFPSANWSSSAGGDVPLSRSYPESRKRIAYMPTNLNDMASYVSHTVAHYHGRIRVWEILNEPVYTDYSLPRAYGYSPADYVRFLKAAYKAVKSTDPDAFVIGGIAGGPTRYTSEFIRAGGLQYIDALNLHIYPGLQSPQACEEPLAMLREKMRVAGFDRPIWFTEGAYYADDDNPVEPFSNDWIKPADSEIEAAEMQVKFDTILMAWGTQRIIYHSGTPGKVNDDSLSGIFFEWAGAPRKMVATQAAMSNLLHSPLQSQGRLDGPESIRAYEFRTAGRTVIVAWTADGCDPVQLPLTDDRSWKALDIQGNEVTSKTKILTERPLYLISKIADAQWPWRHK